MADKAFITPYGLKLARKSAKMSNETAAAKVSVMVDKLQEWKSGTIQPTIKHAGTFAKVFKRPLTEAVTVCIQKINSHNPDHKNLVDNTKALPLADIGVIAHAINENATVARQHKSPHSLDRQNKI